MPRLRLRSPGCVRPRPATDKPCGAGSPAGGQAVPSAGFAGRARAESMGRMDRRWLPLALAAAGALVPRAARADPPRTSALGWARLPGGEACIGARRLAEAVE